jgi:hypothetical protein
VSPKFHIFPDEYQEPPKPTCPALLLSLLSRGSVPAEVVRRELLAAGFSQKRIAKTRTKLRGLVVVDECREVVMEAGLPARWGYFWRLSSHPRLTEEQALAVLRALGAGAEGEGNRP